MATTSSSTAKTHVSLRLPTYLLESIDAHAEKEHISRTEAFVYYLQTGLEISDTKENEPSKDEVLLQSIQDDLTVIKALLQTQPGAVVPAHPYTVPPVEVAEDAAGSSVEDSNDFTTSDAVEESTAAQDEGVDVSLISESENEATEAEALAEEDYATSDAASAPEAPAEDSSLYTFNEAAEEAEEFSTSDAESDEAPEEEIDSVDATDDESAFNTSDATASGEALPLKKLEKTVSKAAKDIASVEKIWLYGNAADAKEIEGPSIDLCIKTENDEKLKSKHLEAFINTVEEKIGKRLNVVLKHEGGKDLKQELKNKVEIYKK